MELFIPNNHTLKAKRQVLRSLITRLRGKFNASVAEVDSLELWQKATLAVACVTNSRRYANSMLSKAVEFVEADGRAEILDYEIELL